MKVVHVGVIQNGNEGIDIVDEQCVRFAVRRGAVTVMFKLLEGKRLLFAVPQSPAVILICTACQTQSGVSCAVSAVPPTFSPTGRVSVLMAVGTSSLLGAFAGKMGGLLRDGLWMRHSRKSWSANPLTATIVPNETLC